MEPAWKKLVDELRNRGHESPYLERLRQRVNLAATGAGSLEAEIVSEMAYSLGRAEDKVNVALLKLEVLGKELAQLEAAGRADRDELRAKREAFNLLRDDALRARTDLMIHREALGFRSSEATFDELYPVPPARRAR